MVKCTYCDCGREATHNLNGWPYCGIHYETLAKIKIPEKVRGHTSEYEGEDEPEPEIERYSGT